MNTTSKEAASSKLKHSRQRDTIKNFLMGRCDHPTAETIYEAVRQEMPSISLGTVYRNLQLLSSIGDIKRLHIEGVDHFDAEVNPHCHFVCRGCNSVMDVATPAALEENASASFIPKDFTGRIEGHMTYFYGLCEKCLLSEKSSLE